jgi:hypothetical protein
MSVPCTPPRRPRVAYAPEARATFQEPAPAVCTPKTYRKRKREVARRARHAQLMPAPVVAPPVVNENQLDSMLFTNPLTFTSEQLRRVALLNAPVLTAPARAFLRASPESLGNCPTSFVAYHIEMAQVLQESARYARLTWLQNAMPNPILYVLTGDVDHEQVDTFRIDTLQAWHTRRGQGIVKHMVDMGIVRAVACVIVDYMSPAIVA